MGFRSYCAAALFAAGSLWLTSSTQREEPLLSGAELAPARLRTLEASFAAHPDDAEALRTLAQSYLDARQPGLALGVVSGAALSVRDDIGVEHIYARALLDEGRSEGALAVEKRVVAACGPLAYGRASAAGCTPALLASAMRRTDILGELVALGVEDARAHPEETLIAYQNATREARVIAQ